MNRMTGLNFLVLASGIFLISCKKDEIKSENIEKREFKTSFESVNDFSSFYITPQGHKGTTYHELSDTIVHSGTYAHKAWIKGVNPPSIMENNNHRGYPTIQLKNTDNGSFSTPCYITIWVWLDMNLKSSTNGSENDWFSFATFTDDESDNWNRTVLVNLSHEGYIHLQNVPNQNQQLPIFQTSNLLFPQKEWVEVKIYLDFRANGYAKVWQNGELVSHANLNNLDNKLSQIHFGMYSPPQISSGVIYNDDLRIVEVNME